MTRFVALISGKGGVGKTSLTLGLGQALADFDKNVVLLDANLTTPNLGLHLGLLNPNATLNEFIRKERSIKDIIHDYKEHGFSIIPASTSFAESQKTNPMKISKVFENLAGTFDFVLVDCPSGLGNDLREVLKHTDEAVVVVNPTNSSVMEALKAVELAKTQDNIITGAILNMTSWWSSHELKKKEIEDILGVQVVAELKNDRKVKKALYQSLPLNYLNPNTRSAKEVDKLASYLMMLEE
jgi:septum site-determining protein MinD